jgi:hypothetical protein
MRADLGSSAEARVLVLEVRNTAAFEAAMRQALFGPVERLPAAALQVEVGEAAPREVRPVGTKFLRRVVLPLPPGNGSVRFSAPRDWWLLRRLWVGRVRDMAEGVVWQPPSSVRGPTPDALRLLLAADRQGVRLEPFQEMELEFPEPGPAGGATRWGYVVRMSGYYEFVSDPGAAGAGRRSTTSSAATRIR